MRLLVKVVDSTISNQRFEVDPVDWPGSPPVGRGDTVLEALGSFLHNAQAKLNITIDLDPSAQAAELRRQADALTQR